MTNNTLAARSIGIDPGKNGAVAWIDWVDGQSSLGVVSKPRTDNDCAALLADLTSDETPTRILLELVNASPRTDPEGKKVRMGASGAFTFGRGFGLWEGIVATLQVTRNTPCRQLASGKWQAKLGKGKFSGDKGKLLQEAQRLYPGQKIYKKQADAVLIAHVCWLLFLEEFRAVEDAVA